MLMRNEEENYDQVLKITQYSDYVGALKQKLEL